MKLKQNDFVPKGTILRWDRKVMKIMNDTTAHGCPDLLNLETNKILPLTLNLHCSDKYANIIRWGDLL